MIAAFLLRLSAGVTFMWILMPRNEVTDGFFRIQLRVLLGFTVLTALLLSSPTAVPAGVSASGTTGIPADAVFWLQCAAAAIAYPGSIFWALGRRMPGTVAIVGLLLTCGGSMAVDAIQSAGVGRPFLNVFAALSSSLVLGSVLTAMLLGHWYLTSPTMSIRPLRFLVVCIGVATCLRLVATIIAFALHGDVLHESTHYIWIGIRIVGAIIAPAAAVILVPRVLQYRNTQSATGILFACLILVFMGEMSASLLETDVGIPF
jgi:hypothetical protein